MLNIEQILSKLISFPVLGGENNLSIIHWIKDYVESFDIPTTLVPNTEGTKAALHCRIGPPVDGGLILSGHTDVVPVVLEKWESNPFELEDKGDGNLYGRGTCDMKGFLATCLNALPKMTKANLKTPIYLAFSYDEEIGCLGAPYLIDDIAKTYTEKPKHAIIGEPTLLQPMTGQKGIFSFYTSLTGSAGHSSRIKSEVSAIHEAARLILWLENKMDILIKDRRIDDRFTPAHTTLHVGQIEGGIATNIIAEHASFTCDVRTIPMDSALTILEDFKTHCQLTEIELKKIFPGFKITIRKHSTPFSHLDTHEDLPIVSLLKKVTGQVRTGTVAFGSEASLFSNAGYDSVICGPGSILQAHRENEFISKDQLAKGAEMINRCVIESSVA